ncbi:MAG: acetyltransferase [Alphaproteobacteria bacterium]|nr:acetyltransferase [Alphaproteobacteria bacterium]
MSNLKNYYSLREKCQIAYWLLKSKIIDRKIRLLRFPNIIRGRMYIDFGEGLTTGINCRFDCFPGKKTSSKKLVFGNNVQLNDYVHIVAMNSVKIGDNVLMASHIFISDNSHGSYKGDDNDTNPNIPPIQREYTTAPVSIGDNTWIGEGVVIMPGVNIGKGCVIGAHSIVNKSIPDYSVAVGSPAKVVKKFDFETSKWQKV